MKSCLLNAYLSFSHFKHYKKMVSFGLLLLVVTVGGWVYFNYQRSNQEEQAASLYDNLFIGFQNADKKVLGDNATKLIQIFPNTSYAQLGALVLARLAVEEGEFKTAIERLQFAVKHKGPARGLAYERLARILIEQQQYQDALNVLEKAPKKSEYTALYEELKGDIYVAQKMLDKAKIAYQASADAMPSGIPLPLLYMKMADLDLVPVKQQITKE